MPRSCGPCRLCCLVMAVPEIHKPKGEWCRHACATGCGIYAERPQPCRDFECAWLTDPEGALLREEDRPDRVGVVFWGLRSEPDGETRELWITAALHPRQVRERGERLIERVATVMPVLRICGDAREVIASRAVAARSALVRRLRAIVAGEVFPVER